MSPPATESVLQSAIQAVAQPKQDVDRPAAQAVTLRAVDSRSDAERRVREDLAAAYRLVAHYGMDDSIYTHISARVPGADGHFLINPFGTLFRDITASSLVKIDLDGAILDDSPYDVNPAGFTIHSAIHAARHDAACVLHTHTVAGVAVSSLACGLQPCNQWALQFHRRVVYHAFEGIALDHDERERLVADLGPTAKAMILRNHGLVTLGRTVAEAFILMVNLERACRVQMAIQASGQPIHEVSPEVAELTARQYESGDSSREPGATDPHSREWRAMLQRIEPMPATSYRD